MRAYIDLDIASVIYYLLTRFPSCYVSSQRFVFKAFINYSNLLFNLPIHVSLPKAARKGYVRVHPVTIKSAKS